MSEYMNPDEYAAMQSAGDIPQEYVEFAKLMVEDKKIPKEIKEGYWGFIGKETVLGKTDLSDKRRSENRMSIMNNMNMMSVPHYKTNIDYLKNMQNVVQKNTIEVGRSNGGFERQALTTQIRQVITNPRNDNNNSTGFFKGLANKLGFGEKPQDGGLVG